MTWEGRKALKYPKLKVQKDFATINAAISSTCTVGGNMQVVGTLRVDGILTSSVTMSSPTTSPYNKAVVINIAGTSYFIGCTTTLA